MSNKQNAQLTMLPRVSYLAKFNKKCILIEKFCENVVNMYLIADFLFDIGHYIFKQYNYRFGYITVVRCDLITNLIKKHTNVRNNGHDKNGLILCANLIFKRLYIIQQK